MQYALDRKKRMLILEASGSKAEPHECKGLCEQASLFGIETICKAVSNNTELNDILSSSGAFNYVYLSAHGSVDSFESEDGEVNMTWSDFADALCENNCLQDDSILMLSCCRGGLMQVAYELFDSCTQICYVLGPRQDLASIDMLTCFSVFLYNIEQRGLDPVVACEKIKCATDQRFSCYDRQEEEGNIESYNSTFFVRAIYEKIAQDEDRKKENPES